MNKLNLDKKVALALNFPQTAINVAHDKLFGITNNIYPRIIDLFLTESCNFACPMCHVRESRKRNNRQGGLDFEFVKKIILESKKWSPSFQLIGGEPTLYEKLPQTINLISKNKMISGVTTNGLLLKKFAQEFIDNGLNFLAVSLDGWDEESQKKRGNVPGTFDKIIAGIQEVIKLRGNKKFPNIRIATVITKNNFQSIGKIGKVLNNLAIDRWSISHYYFVTDKILSDQLEFYKRTGIGADIWGDNIGSSPYFSQEELNILKNQLNEVGKMPIKNKIDFNDTINLNNFYSFKFPSAKSTCLVPYNELFIRGNGDLELCQGYKLGNIEKDKIKDVWFGGKAENFRKIFKKNKLMPGCFRCCALNMKFD
jgi:MoaA/NifB/PqqE/SkfB family radical SAM enzyme